MSKPSGNAVRAYIGLGSNLAHPVRQVQAGMSALTQLEQTRVEACSSFYRTAPVGLREQPDFINAVCRVCTDQAPETLMRKLLEIESEHGRVRHGDKGGPRTLDLDLLLYGDQVIRMADLSVPHPRLHERAFVLYPLHEIEPDLVIPGHGPLREMLADCSGQPIQKIDA